MIFERAARREFSHSAAGVFAALFAILISTQMIRLLGEAAGGRLAPEAVAAFLGFSALNYLPVLLSLTLFISILLPLSRAYRDSEMVVWFASGLPLTAWLRPVFHFSLPIIVAVAVLALFLSPWAASQSADYRNRLNARNDATRITPGAFQEASAGERIVFVEQVEAEAGYVRNVFVTTVQDGRLGVVMAAMGRQETMPNGDRFLMLHDGRRYEVEPGSAEFRVLAFDRYGVRLFDARVRNERGLRAIPTLDLWGSRQPREQGELLWRLGLPVSTLLLALLAIPLSFVNPRAGRSLNLLLAVALFSLYNNLLSISQAWVAREQLSWQLALFLPHVLMLLILALLFYRRLTILAFWRRRR
ncbi:MAG: LPS export ABC transporter permease LptF [Zoogloeaceae bacterium]|jgi:lipopolysaccharide export system permease protein|nr:LPS export ABC transporter permease LptF [Zoogloeaceae bacterium]